MGNPGYNGCKTMSYLKKTPRWVKVSERRLIWQYRRATWRSRALPDFIIVGAQKSGTTSLYTYLGQHPQLLPSYGKEVHFFDGGLDPNADNYTKGQAWYRAHFPLKKNVSTNYRTFEASPLYIFNTLTPKRIYDLIPEVKLIAILRNPTERAISHYFHEKREGHESLPIMEALQEENKRLESVINDKDCKSDIFIHHSYKSRGLYKQQLERFLKYFSPQQILVLSSENLFSEPGTTLRHVFRFLRVDTEFKVKDLKSYNVANKKIEVNPDVYTYLNDYFSPHNEALFELIGKRFGWQNAA